MVDDSKGRLQAVLTAIESNPDVTALRIAAKTDTTREEIETYVAATYFMAWWFEKQDGAAGHDTVALFEQFKTNVCAIMAKGTIKA